MFSCADGLDERRDDVQARLQRAHVAAEALDRVFHALRHRFDALEDQQDDEHQEDKDEDREDFHCS